MAVAALTLAALLVRVLGIDQSIWGDELYSFDILRDGASGVIRRSRPYDANPPLYFWLASFTDLLGDHTIWLRLPSIVLGAATVPLVYRLGALTVGRAAGLVGAAILAFSPFAVWYGIEARPYAPGAFFATASSVTLLSALRGESGAWWFGFWAATTAAIYTQFISAFVLAPLVVWALWTHPAQRRAVLMACAGAALAFLPYLPTFHRLAGRPQLETPITVHTMAEGLTRLVAGHPQLGVRPVIGTLGVTVLAVVAAAAVVALVAKAAAPRRAGSLTVQKELVLVASLAAAAPVGIVIYHWLGGPELGLPRSFLFSLPAICLLLGAAICALPRPAATVATVAVALVLCVASLKTAIGPFQRPQVRAAAHLVDARAAANVPVIEVPSLATVSLRLSDITGSVVASLLPFTFVGPPDKLSPPGQEISVQFRRPHPRYGITGYGTISGGLQPEADPRAWAAGDRVGRLYVISGERAGLFVPPTPPPGSRLVLASRRSYDGADRVVVDEYVAAR